MKKILFTFCCGTALLLYACGGDTKKETKTDSFEAKNVYGDDKPNPDHEKKGIGKFTNVEVSGTLDKVMSESGQKVYDLKCSACHKLTEEKLVGPGWKNVTTRRKPEWIMNFATNTDEMITKDPAAQSMLEECMVRMPNQNLSDADARAVYEFMRKNDGVK